MTWKNLIEMHREIDSTMIRGSQLAIAGADEGTTVVAEHQTHGRGRHGRSWFSSPGGGLYVSTLLRPSPEQLAFLPSLSLVVGCAVWRFLVPLVGSRVRLKWPNDLVVEDRKIAGILMEADTQHLQSLWILAGVGINIRRAQELNLPPDLRARYVGVHDLVDVTVSLDLLGWAQELLQFIEEAYTDWRQNGMTKTLETWERANALQNQWVRVENENRPLVGQVVGVAADGALRIVCEKKEVLVRAGEVVKLQSLAGGI